MAAGGRPDAGLSFGLILLTSVKHVNQTDGQILPRRT
jgi:hypothetical protein